MSPWRGRQQRERAKAGKGLVHGPDNPVPESTWAWARSRGYDLDDLFPEGVLVVVSRHRVSIVILVLLAHA
jgi:hypothetical protein